MNQNIQPVVPGPGQESVWDYPRPPRLEASERHLKVIFGGEIIAETRRGHRVLETSHPPVFYFPLEDVNMRFLEEEAGHSYCEWKGSAAYYSIRVGDHFAPKAAWYYPNPTASFLPIKDAIAFYADQMTECWVDGEQVVPQPGGFYGGWITSEIVGPFKGEPGSVGW